jgi:uncharacterized Zn finger protein
MSELVAVLLAEGRTDEAWAAHEGVELSLSDAKALYKARAEDHPEDVVVAYRILVDQALTTADRRNYDEALKLLRLMAKAAARCSRMPEVAAYVAELREKHRRRPSFIELLDRATPKLLA